MLLQCSAFCCVVIAWLLCHGCGAGAGTGAVGCCHHHCCVAGAATSITIVSPLVLADHCGMEGAYTQLNK